MSDTASTTSEGVWPLSSHENDAKSKYGETNERDVVGYGANPVNPHWPKAAKVALNFVINYEEGGEMCTLHGDGASEHLLSDNGPNTQPYGKDSSTCLRFTIHAFCSSGYLPICELHS